MTRPDFLVIYRTDTMEVTSIVDPENEWEVYDPCWTKNEKVELKAFRMPRGPFAGEIEYNCYGAIIARAEEVLKWLRK